MAETEKEAEKARRDSKKARDEFNDVKKRRSETLDYPLSGLNAQDYSRCDLFNKAFTHISERIDQIYKDLTKGKAAPLGGVAYLSLEDNEVRCLREFSAYELPLTLHPQEPYAGGIKYHAMPPMKRFRDMEQLSGGEKTVAALALLFAVHRSVNDVIPTLIKG